MKRATLRKRNIMKLKPVLIEAIKKIAHVLGN